MYYRRCCSVWWTWPCICIPKVGAGGDRTKRAKKYWNRTELDPFETGSNGTEQLVQTGPKNSKFFFFQKL